ncbi:phosphodiester glycosidase family protein [Thermohalobacter berrensis]|uniref:Phosphodiester glycosidase domain-containing protein n=1 Tax=Thermohalobacter berrensis TaxID=99594 RepID=A0A419T431_9FIRM|nr:phosphodiester glycosidase family protein [Thermohalobacter berrensis]RKD32314.1 hypothetical protein BET03_03115 [Thermohalobacter berrensis]
MNKYIRKIVSGIVGGALLISSSTFGISDSSILIHERKWEENISSGVILEKIQRFTSAGWRNINVLRVDLDDRYTDIGVLFSDKGISTREKLSNMVKEKEAIAGINGDFFSTEAKPYPLGAVISEGKIVSSPYDFNKDLPVFSVDEDKKPLISYWNWEMSVIPENGKPIKISTINKYSKFTNVVVMYNKHWNGKTPGNTNYSDIVEVLVEDNIVKDIRIGQPPTDIPEDGYVLISRGPTGMNLANNFNIGDKVKIDIKGEIDYKKIKAAIGGGTFLVKDGEKTDFTLNVKGKHPRTALGITKDRDELIMVTIDGRDTSFKGVELDTLAEIMIDLGAYEAINLDGGGSTTMVVSPNGVDSPQVVNHPSDGNERRIVNGLGIFSDAPKRRLDYIQIFTEDTNVFVNTTRKFYVKGYDKYHNPVKIDLDRVDFDIEGVKGRFKDNVFMPEESGTATIKAEYRGKEAEIYIRVLNELKDLYIENDKFHVDIDGKVDLGEIYGINTEGFTAKINPNDINWHIIGDIGKIRDGVFYSSNKPSSGAIVASVEDAVENILVSVGYSEVEIEDFEDLDNIEFIPYPESVKGNIELANEDKEGTSSVKLKYDFTESEGTSAGYILFGEDGLKLKGSPDKIGMWIHGNNSNHWIRGKITDSNGNTYPIDFTQHVNWNGWEWVTADIPRNVSYPIKLNRIYVVEINPLNFDKGEILFDGLKALYRTPFKNIELPKETVVKDNKQKHVEVNENGYKFMVTGGINKIDNLLDYQILKRTESYLNKNEVGIVMDKLDKQYLENNNKPILEVTSGYSSFKHKDTYFIQLDNSKGGIRQTDYNQWIWLKNKLLNVEEKNIIVVLPKPVFGPNGFVDKLEADLFHEILSNYSKNGKDVWVIHGGDKIKVNLKDGIRYIQFNNPKIEETKDIYNLKYLSFAVNNGEITYEILPMFKRSIQ